MIRILEQRVIALGIIYIEGACVSTDVKPTTGICTGSKLTEADTGDVYMFYEDDSNPNWGKIAAGPTQG
jgi:hypothetical protein